MEPSNKPPAAADAAGHLALTTSAVSQGVTALVLSSWAVIVKATASIGGPSHHKTSAGRGETRRALELEFKISSFPTASPGPGGESFHQSDSNTSLAIQPRNRENLECSGARFFLLSADSEPAPGPLRRLHGACRAHLPLSQAADAPFHAASLRRAISSTFLALLLRQDALWWTGKGVGMREGRGQ